MLKVDQDWIDKVSENYPIFRRLLERFEKAVLPACPHCGSEDTADVQVGLIGLTIHLSAATTKFKLIPKIITAQDFKDREKLGPNRQIKDLFEPPGIKPGKYYCNACKAYFNDEWIVYPDSDEVQDES